MSLPVITAARQIRTDLRAQEDSVDTALAGQARLISRLLEARVAAGIPAAVGAEIVDTAILAVSQFGELRRTVRQMHTDLAELDIRSIGDTLDCPKVEGVLHIVTNDDSEARTA